MTKKYFINFVEEGICNPDYEGYVAGRVEVFVETEYYATEEIRFLTDKLEEYYEFRDKWDFQYVNQKQLNEIKEKAKCLLESI